MRRAAPNTNRYFLALVICLFIPSAHAANEFYGGLGVGYSLLSSNKSNIVNSYSQISNDAKLSNDATSLKAFFGYQFDEYLSVESEFMTIGDIVAKEGGSAYKLFNTESFTLVGMLGRDVTDYLRVYARLGGHYWDISEDSNSDKSINSAVDFTYGVGIDLNLYGEKNRQLRFQVNRFHYDGVFLNSAYVASIDIIFYFGPKVR